MIRNPLGLQALMDTQQEMLDAGCPKRQKSDNDEAVPFYYSGNFYYQLW